LKIVDINPFFHPYLGGIEARLLDTCRLFAKRGHDVTMVTGQLPGTEAEEEMDGFKIIRLKSKFINIYNPPFISSKNVLETVESLNADIVNYNYRWAPSYNKDMGEYKGKKIFTYHNMWGEGLGLTGKFSEMSDNRFRKYLETYDHIICVSNFVRDDVVARGFAPEKVSTVPSCLNTLPEISDREGDFILSLGRLVKTKGLDYMLTAMRDIDCKLIICGRGPEAKRINKLVRKYKLEEKVKIKGWVSEEEKTELMSTCKMFVMPSIFESLGIAALEVMSYGRPMVCTNVNGLPETVGDGGIIVPPKDPNAIADAVNSLLENNGKRKEFGIAARAHTEKFLWDHHIDELERIYQQVIDS